MRIPILVLALAVASFAAASPPPQLERAVAAWHPNAPPRSFSFALFDLNEDGFPDALVLMTDAPYCGSGGCTLVVFQGMADGSFRPLPASTIAREPVRILKQKEHGWHAFTVLAGAGAARPCLRVMAFDGRTYPSNPLLLPCATPGAVHWSIPVKLVPNT